MQPFLRVLLQELNKFSATSNEFITLLHSIPHCTALCVPFALDRCFVMAAFGENSDDESAAQILYYNGLYTHKIK